MADSILEKLDEIISDVPDERPEVGQAGISSAGGSGGRDRELEDMQREAPLLDLIRADTGELGSGSGDTVYFHHCPICGHNDCFRFHASSNSWACWGGSNPNRNARDGAVEVGGYLRYVLRTRRARDNDEAVRLLREATGHPYARKADQAARKADQLPPWVQCRAHDPRKEPPELIHGLLRRQHVGIMAAKGKGSKTWGALRLAIEVTQGGSVCGHKCERGTVLFIDAEMGVAAIDNRVSRICDALGYDKADVDGRLSVWSVEGLTVGDGDGERAPDICDLLAAAEARAARFDLVVIDSCSNFLPRGYDENSNPDVSTFYARCRRLTQVTGAACWLVHHFGKGAQGDREAADMLRGASAWLDRPSVALVMCEILPPKGQPSDYLAEGERAFRIECVGIRSFAAPESADVIWGYPTHRLDEKGATRDWAPKSSQRSAARAAAEVKAAEAKVQGARIEAALLGYFYTHETDEDGVQATKAAAIASEAIGKQISAKAVKASLEGSEYLAVYRKSARKHFIVPVHAMGSAIEDGAGMSTIDPT